MGYDQSDLSWEPVENLSNASLTIKAFHEKHFHVLGLDPHFFSR